MQLKTQAAFILFVKKNWFFLLYIIVTISMRFWNFQNSLYFIYDQGRDAVAMQRIAQGHFVLVGPTTGLNGIFLGPLWWYINLPAFILSGGNPYGIALWDIALSCLALPLFWWVSHKLFQKKFFSVLCAVFLAIIPGSIQASIFVWNPLLSVPLMMATLISIYKARESRTWLAIGFFLLALTLQSEFAYAIFFIPVLFFSIPWVRQKFDVKDFLVSGLSIGVTLFPQLLFDIRNHFLMTQTLLRSLHDSSNSVSWAQQFDQRPQQLIDTGAEILIGRDPQFAWFIPILFLLIIVGFLGVVKNIRSKKEPYIWKLLALFAFAPYPFFLVWRGNHGYFFWYYISCHFMFLLPLFFRGLEKLVHIFSFSKAAKQAVLLFIALCIAVMGLISASHWYSVVFAPINNAGTVKMLSAVKTIYNWKNQDRPNEFTVRTYTANVYTEQYDYLFSWYAKAHHISAPSTVLLGKEDTWYIVIESRDAAQKFFFDPWYKDATKNGQRIRQTQVGVLTLETWQRIK